MKPRYNNYPGGRGAILVWRDNPSFIVEQALNYDTNETCDVAAVPSDPCYKFYWGYPPENGGLQNQFEIRIGFYRPTPLTNMTVLIDDISLN